MKDYELATKSLEDLMEPFVASLPIEKRLRGISPQELGEALGGALTIEQLDQMIAALPAEKRELLNRRPH